MSNRKLAKIIFASVWVIVFAWAVVNIIVSINFAAYLDEDIEHNFVTWMGITYGVGMGSISFVGRAMAAGVAGIMLNVMSLWIFPTWLKVHEFKDEQD